MWASCNILRELGEITEFHTVFNANFAVKGVLPVKCHSTIGLSTDWRKQQIEGKIYPFYAKAVILIKL